MSLVDQMKEAMVSSKSLIIKLGIAKFAQNSLFAVLYYVAYVKGVPANVCEDTWFALYLQILCCGPLLASAVIAYVVACACEAFWTFTVMFGVVR